MNRYFFRKTVQRIDVFPHDVKSLLNQLDADSLPTVINVNGKQQYKYKNLKIREIEGKGLGIVATGRLEPGFTFPYEAR
jgi:hypothetical protein